MSKVTCTLFTDYKTSELMLLLFAFKILTNGVSYSINRYIYRKKRKIIIFLTFYIFSIILILKQIDFKQDTRVTLEINTFLHLIIHLSKLMVGHGKMSEKYCYKLVSYNP